MTNPFLDPEGQIRYGLKLKDLVLKEPEARPKDSTPPDQPVGRAKGFSLEELADCYKITGVQGGAYDLSKTLLDSKTQDNHAMHAKNAKPTDFRACNAPLVYAICKALYDNMNDATHKVVVEKARQDLRKFFADHWLFTLSRVAYNPARQPGSAGQPDSIIHDYKQTSQSKENVELVGPDGFITNSKSNALVYSQKLLGTKDSVQQINTVFEWISGKKAYAYRVNAKPAKREERVVALGIGINDGFVIVVDIDVSRPALGVRPSQKISSGNKGRSP